MSAAAEDGKQNSRAGPRPNDREKRSHYRSTECGVALHISGQLRVMRVARTGAGVLDRGREGPLEQLGEGRSFSS